VDLSKRQFLLRWDDAARIRWDILILFGGGLALAGGIGSSGLAEWIGDASAAWRHLPPLLLIAAVTIVVVYLGELASNTAMAAVFLPIAGAVAVGMGENPLTLVLPIALAASLGFMLPVATPPNAIVFGSGAVEMRHMLRAGVILDVIGIVVVGLAIVTLGRWVLAPG
jgi:sodium-dependent dicarboxylate transporter 2/3/5